MNCYLMYPYKYIYLPVIVNKSDKYRPYQCYIVLNNFWLPQVHSTVDTDHKQNQILHNMAEMT